MPTTVGSTVKTYSTVQNVPNFFVSSWTDALQIALDKINEAWKVASEEMYKAQAEGQQAEGQQPDPASADADQGSDVEDVDFEEVK